MPKYLVNQSAFGIQNSNKGQQLPTERSGDTSSLQHGTLFGYQKANKDWLQKIPWALHLPNMECKFGLQKAMPNYAKNAT